MTTKISQPTVETITAELFVVKIGNKQMTVSVYNQLYCEDCWDKEYNIIYPVWGKTNRDEEYLIFQKGNELRKCKMPYKLGKLNFNTELILFIKRHSERILKTIPKEYLYPLNAKLPEEKKRPYLLLNKITYTPERSILRPECEEALTVLDETILSEFKAIYQKQNWLNEKHEKMVDELKNSRQLFIAV